MVKKAKPEKANEMKPTVVSCGFDISMSSIAGCAKMYDGVIGKMRGPVWYMKRFHPSETFFDRMKSAVLAHDHVLDLVVQMNGAIFDIDEIYIGVEEVPVGFMKGKGQSNRVRQQAQITGAFMGGLAKWGYTNLYEVNVKSWRSIPAGDLDVKQNADFDKWTVKEWVKEIYPEAKFRDLIYRKVAGQTILVPQPKGNKAKPSQPDDRYDSTGVMEWVWEEAIKESKLPKAVKEKLNVVGVVKRESSD